MRNDPELTIHALAALVYYSSVSTVTLPTVGVAKLLLQRGANINTHSAEFKESALTLACYKGHLEMVRFLLEAGADQEHKTDEMHTALMEASMVGGAVGGACKG